MNQVPQYYFAMLSSLKHNTVNSILVKGKNSCCPPNTVTFSNGQNYTSNGLPTVVGVHKNSITIFRKPLFTCLTTQQISFVFAITCARCDIPTTSNSKILTVRIRTEIIIKFYHLNPPLGHIFNIVPKRRPDSNIN
jgi:hypothetical protein